MKRASSEYFATFRGGDVKREKKSFCFLFSVELSSFEILPMKLSEREKKREREKWTTMKEKKKHYFGQNGNS